jgi:hypothetical protein
MPKPGAAGSPPSNQGQQSKDFTKAVADWTKALAGATILLFLASLVADYFICQQWTAAVDAQNDARKQLNAYVVFFGIIMINNNSPDGKTINYAVIPRWQNYGGTRTAHFDAWTNIKYFDKAVPDNMDFSRPEAKIDYYDSTIAGNGAYDMPALGFEKEKFIKAKNGEGVIVVWGRADWQGLYDTGPATLMNPLIS